jgi:DNA-binding LacI/PurR family transcriptional regulator
MSHSGNGRSTIFEVAEGAGVSITTVSHVFSGKRRVNEQTRRRVLEIAGQLAYRPRATAQALATGRTNTLALQISATGQNLILNPFFTALLPALSLAAIERDLSFVYVPPADAGSAFIEPLIDQRRIDGALLVDPVASDPFVLALERSEVPRVSIGRIVGDGSEYWVDNDHGVACAKVLSHLTAMGYGRPCLVTLPMEVSYVLDYDEGFRAALDGAGTVVVADDLSERSGYEAVGRALDGPNPPDAFFCIHDVLAIGALHAASERDIRIPEDVGVVGVTDTSLASKAHPSLSSVRVFPERAAASALELLDALLRGADVDAPVILPSRLVTRRSTARIA